MKRIDDTLSCVSRFGFGLDKEDEVLRKIIEEVEGLKDSRKFILF